MVSCSEFLTELGNYLEGDVSAELRRELEAHLAYCRTCQVIVDSTRKTVTIVTESGESEFTETLPEPLLAKIMDRVRAKATTDIISDVDEC